MYKYKLVSYKLWDGEKLKENFGNNKEYFLNKMKKPDENYRHELYEKIGRKWVMIANK